MTFSRIVHSLLVHAIPVCLILFAEVAHTHDLPGAEFAGVWEHIGNFRKFPTEPQFTPEAAAYMDQQTKQRALGDYSGDTSALCIPPSLPTMITIGAQELLVDEKKITWIMESISGVRWIWLDGRALP